MAYNILMLGVDTVSNYNGYRCPVCGKAFVTEDDVVVCPDCGAPHHRACYRSLGHCAFEDRHAAGEQWSPLPPDDDAQEPAGQTGTTVPCPRCGSHNPASNIFCQVCGQQLTAGQAPGPSPYGPSADGQGYRPAASPGQNAAGQENVPPWVQTLFTQVMEEPEIAPGISNREVCDYVGPNNLVFLLRFQRLLRSGSRISINWSAFFFSFFYCYYRKMYKMGTVLLVITIASLIPTFLCIPSAAPMILDLFQQNALTTEALNALPIAPQLMLASNIYNITSIAIRLFCGLFFNAAYCRQVCQGILTVREREHCSSGSPEYHYALIRRGGVNINAVLLVICCIIVLYVLVSFGFAYQMLL